ncbi:RpiB/LacA/LacB family sugar-phosphate isomerase [bacterium]|uniref:Ribose-5-phosphate isomerase n=2 Tax=Katanobacteria TaxID=422282 RepID=A0A2M7X5C2_UNCKA|nr:RpiB/LacA/LacB family sugar-phosphate isomerase [bacterium]PIP56540.1 MAG: hypothetical protein COX05_02400 [candidate division WWE3 bacterium CG22_combo_CG10-13_8_21_14_all_39_12]PJA41337.1 MAG: hypothetical protein CO179_00155 [candidate division WWE3 bacterium CG_4_9_14_3_um_filter_39_7]
MKIVIAADHRGFELKESILLDSLFADVEFIDSGAHSFDEDDDYTSLAADAVFDMTARDVERAVLICGSGVGMCVMANKFNGIRCGIGISPEQVASARMDDDMNVLAISADYTDHESVVTMIRVFVDTDFKSTSRFERRLNDIAEIEQN